MRKLNILYGVQGTGNGHLSRAREMARAFTDHPNVSIDWVFSGRQPDQYFDMTCFGKYKTFKGLSYVTKNGSLDLYATIKKLDLGRFVRDLKSLNAHEYDLVITDFEPLTAWAAKRAGVDSIGLSHQSAFYYNIPKTHHSFIDSLVMRHFAPAKTQVGVHWSHYSPRIVPPIIPNMTTASRSINRADEKNILVYFPFESVETLIDLFMPFSNFRFQIFHNVETTTVCRHITVHPISKKNFRRQFNACGGVICGAGFELPSEALSQQKKLLVSPLAGQTEQHSNASALDQLDYAMVCNKFDRNVIIEWLRFGEANHLPRIDVADSIAEWIALGRKTPIEVIAASLWDEIASTSSPRPYTPFEYSNLQRIS